MAPEVQRTIERPSLRGRIVLTAGLVTSLSAGIVACTEAGQDSARVEVEVEAAGERSLSIADLRAMPARPVTQGELANGGYNCGHTVETGEENFSEQIDYLNSKPELVHNLLDFNANDTEWGMGQEAWDILISRGVKNQDTPNDKKIDANADNSDHEMNRYMHRVRSVSLDHEVTNVNFTCDDGEGNTTEVRAVGMVKITSQLNGIALRDEDLIDFVQAFEQEKGQVTVRIEDLGMQEVNGEKVHLSLVVTEATGCENPQRILPPRKPGEQPTPVDSTTTTTGTTPDTFPPKRDKPTNVAGPGGGKPQKTPAPSVEPTPDDGSKNPVGTTSTTKPPATSTSTSTTVTAPATTAPPPSITAPQG